MGKKSENNASIELATDQQQQSQQQNDGPYVPQFPANQMLKGIAVKDRVGGGKFGGKERKKKVEKAKKFLNISFKKKTQMFIVELGLERLMWHSRNQREPICVDLNQRFPFFHQSIFHMLSNFLEFTLNLLHLLTNLKFIVRTKLN